MILALKIIGAIVALALGIWLGLPGRYSRDLDEIDEIMDQGGRRRRKVKRRFTAVAWMYRKLGSSSGRGHQRRRGFNLESPEDR